MCINTKAGPKCLCSEGFYLDGKDKTCKPGIDLYHVVDFVFKNE